MQSNQKYLLFLAHFVQVLRTMKFCALDSVVKVILEPHVIHSSKGIVSDLRARFDKTRKLYGKTRCYAGERQNRVVVTKYCIHLNNYLDNLLFSSIKSLVQPSLPEKPAHFWSALLNTHYWCLEYVISTTLVVPFRQSWHHSHHPRLYSNQNLPKRSD